MEDIYIMAHRANSIAQFNDAMDNGFNAIEFDVTKGKDGRIYSWHGENGAGWALLSDYLDHAAQAILSDERRRVCLLIVDLKYHKKAGLSLDDIRDVIEDVRIRVLDPVNSAENASPQNGIFALYTTTFTGGDDQRFIEAILKKPLSPHEGVNLDADFWHRRSETDTAWIDGFVNDAIRWRNANVINNLMLSAGYAGGTPVYYNGWREVLRVANDQRRTNVFGTYAWTFQRARGGANTLAALELDGVMGNSNRRFGRLSNELGGFQLNDHQLVTRSTMPPFKRLRSD